MPKISVIVPVYNTEPEYIQTALDSLFNQTLSDLEIIIVNDGSTDASTCNYLKELESNKKLQIINQPNMGQSVARNTALDIATGDFIGFLDSDDWLDSNFYEVLYKKCIESGADIACGVLHICDINQEFNLDTHTDEITNRVKKKVANITNGSVCTKIFRRRLFDGIRFPAGLYYEDNLTLLELMLKSDKVVFSTIVQYYYRTNPNSTTHDDIRRDKRIRDSVIILEKIKLIAETCSRSQRSIIINTFLRILFMPDIYLNVSDYRNSMDKIFGDRYLKRFLPDNNEHGCMKKIFHKAKRFIFRIQNNRIKIFKITVYKIKR